MSIFEEWKTIEGHHRYKISNKGRVLSYAKDVPVFIKPCFNENANTYLFSCQDDASYNKKLVLSREVAKAFVPNPNGLNCVTHIDGNIHNNNYSNLKWVHRNLQVTNTPKPIRCIELGFVAESKQQMQNYLFLKGYTKSQDDSGVRSALRRNTTYLGFHFEYVDKERIRNAGNS